MCSRISASKELWPRMADRVRKFHMISTRGNKEHKFSFFACILFIAVLNVEVFLFLTEYQEKNGTSCDPSASLIYPNRNKSEYFIALLLNKWKNHTGNNYVIVSVPRKTNKIVIIIPLLEPGDKNNFKDLLKTISQISNYTQEDQKLDHTFMILFDSQFRYDGLIQQILTDFSADVLVGFLQLVKVPFSDNFLCCKTFGQEINHEICNFLCVISAASAYLSTQGSYVWLMNNDVEILDDGFLRNAMKFIKKTRKPWSVLDFSDHMSADFTGKLIRMNDLNKFIYFFFHLLSQPSFRDSDKAFYEAHLDYIHLMYQSNFILFRPSMMVRRSQMLSLDANSSLFDLLSVDKWRSNDPSGVVVTSMTAIDFKHSPMRAYGSLPNQYFEAKISKYGDWFAIVFDEDIRLGKIILELDYRNASTKSDKVSESISQDFIIKGILEVSPKLVKLDIQKNTLTCGDYMLIGNIRGHTTVANNLQEKLSGRPTKCLKFTLSLAYPISNFIIKQLAVFTED